MPDPSLALDLHHIDKRYGPRVHALKGISLQVRRGEIFGLLGPNGAGKSTLVKILMTVVRPTRADGFVLGQKVATKSSLAKVGYLPENHRFPRYLTGRQTLDFFASLSGTPKSTRSKRIPELLDIVGMTPWADQPISRYSKGMMQRVGIAQALVADPDLVVLDEPTDGVDPVGRRDIRDVLLRMRDEGKTVFVNSHLLSELELVCSRVAIMVAGQVAQQGTLAELTSGRRWYELEVEAHSAAQIAGALNLTLAPSSIRAIPYLPTNTLPPEATGHLPSGTAVEALGSTLRVGSPDAASLQPLLDELRSKSLILKRFQPREPNLEQLFIEAIELQQGRPGYVAGATIGGAR